jgi:hypothetical protein
MNHLSSARRPPASCHAVARRRRVRTFPIFTFAFLLALAFPLSLRADTIKFPKDNPAVSVDLPSGWKSEWVTGDAAKLGGERLQFSTDNAAADLSIKELPADAGITDEESAKANFSKVALADMKTLEPTKCGDVEEKTIAGHKAFGTMVTTGLGPMFYAIFTADGKKYFSMFSINGGADPIVALIKPAE